MLPPVAVIAADVQALRDDLAANPSATAVLQARCDRLAGPGVRIRARQVPLKPSPALDRAARATLGADDREPLRRRRVELVCGDRVFSRADNWYLPARLTPGMNRILETTETPFGVAVASLRFQRRPMRSETLAGSDILRNRARLITPEGHAFSLVVETYTVQSVAR